MACNERIFFIVDERDRFLFSHLFHRNYFHWMEWYNRKVKILTEFSSN